MRNWKRCSGVYSYMHRVPLLLICSLAAAAQKPPQRDPIDAAIQSAWQARNDGRFDEAAAARERAHALLQGIPAASPRYLSWVQQVASLYQGASLNGQARTIWQEALARTALLGETNPAHAAILSSLGEAWWQDGNLLKAEGYLEQAAAAQATASPSVAAQPGVVVGSTVLMGRLIFQNSGRGGYVGSAIFAYTRLAQLYQQLGRPDAVAALAAKIRSVAASDEAAVARFYEQRGELAEAAAIYQKMAEESADPQAKANAWQALANLDARQEHYADAVAVMQQAVGAVQASDKPGVRNQTVWMRQALAGYQRQAGMIEQADQTFQQILQEARGGPYEGQVLNAYSQYLGETKREAQGESLLKDYLAGGGAVDPQQKANALYGLANLARRGNNPDSAEEYQKAAQALQLQASSQPAQQILIGDDLQKAQVALNQKRMEDAYNLILHALDIAPQATDRQQVAWGVPQVAGTLAANKQQAKAEQLFQRLLALVETWKGDNLQPLIAATQSYARFLMNQPDRLAQVPAAIQQYESALAEANGADSGTLAEAFRVKIEFERSHAQWRQAEDSARELLEFQESLSGNTSEPYLRDLQTAAQVYVAAGDTSEALPMLRKTVAIADLVVEPNNEWNRVQTRMQAAQTLANVRQFDEAERLAEEAVALQKPAQRQFLVQQLEQIRRMKQAATTANR